MRWAFLVLSGLSFFLPLPAQTNPSAQDMSELAALKEKVLGADAGTKTEAKPAAKAAAKPTPKPEAGTTDDIAEIEALKARVQKNNSVTENTRRAPLKVQIIHSDEHNSGFELVLVLEHDVPAPAVIRASGHAVGEKIFYPGIFEGAAKFEGAYYPFLKSTRAEDNRAKPTEAENPGKGTPATTEAEKIKIAESAFEGYPPATVIFLIVGVLLLTVTILKIKASWQKQHKSPRH